MTKPIKIPLRPKKVKIGAMWHVELPELPHPLRVQCSECMAQRGQLCYDEDSESEDPFKATPRLKGGYHVERVRWAKELHKRQEEERNDKTRKGNTGRDDSSEGDS